MNENLNYDIYIHKEYNIIKENEVYNLRLEFDQININFKLKKINESIDYIYKNKYKIAFFINKLELNPNKFSNYELVINTFDKLYNNNNILIDKINDDNVIIKIKYDDIEKEIQLYKEYMNINDKINIMYNQLKFINNNNNIIKLINDNIEIKKMKKEINELKLEINKKENNNNINFKDNIIDGIINEKIDKIIKSFNNEFKNRDEKIMELNKKLLNQENEIKNKNKQIELINDKLEEIKIELNDYQQKMININLKSDGSKINEQNKNSEYENIINYKFVKEPQNLKYKYDITNTNIKYGLGDIFEIFISYKDNKEYVVSPNINNNNIDIFTIFHSMGFEDLFYKIKKDCIKLIKKNQDHYQKKNY